jgi:P-type Cu+ transporter
MTTCHIGSCFATRAAMLGGAVVLLVGATTVLAAVQASAAPDPEVPRFAIEATGRGYQPDTVRVVAGAPADLVFTRTAASGCAAQVHIPDLGVDKTALPLGEPVTIRITPAEPGAYEFRCGMNMLRGTIIAAPPPPQRRR